MPLSGRFILFSHSLAPSLSQRPHSLPVIHTFRKGAAARPPPLPYRLKPWLQVLIKSEGKMQWHPGLVTESYLDGSSRATVSFDIGFSAEGTFGRAFFVCGGASNAYKWLDGPADVSDATSGSEPSQQDAGNGGQNSPSESKVAEDAGAPSDPEDLKDADQQDDCGEESGSVGDPESWTPAVEGGGGGGGKKTSRDTESVPKSGSRSDSQAPKRCACYGPSSRVCRWWDLGALV